MTSTIQFKLSANTVYTFQEIRIPITASGIISLSQIVRKGGPDEVIKSEIVLIEGKQYELGIFKSGLQLIVSTNSVAIPEKYDGIISVKNSFIRWIYNREYEFVKEKFAEKKHHEICEIVTASWEGKFKLNSKDAIGLRPPQKAALFAIGSHWTLEHEAATIVMPTGTGKTETMISSVVAFSKGRVLIIVPSKALREQTLNKFLNLGLLKDLGLIDDSVKCPVVGYLNKRISKEEDLKDLEKCNIIISTIQMIGQSTSAGFGKKISDYFSYLFIDEAHHVSAKTWNDFKSHFNEKKVVQFTATPFRRDGKIVDGKNIFNYSLGRAQEDNYFKRINYVSVFEIETDKADEAIAEEAVAQLEKDLAFGLDHLIMARCESIARAEQIFKIYSRIAPSFNPILINSDLSSKKSKDLTSRLFNRTSRILICVNMFGEGFDLPNLKIAAIHDPHQSLSIVLQFTGRFTRTSEGVGEATFIGNNANSRLSDSIDRLYSEDADWNKILSDHSSRAIKAHEEMIEFLRNCIPVEIGEGNEKNLSLVPQMLYPKFSVVAYNAGSVQLKDFYKGLGKGTQLAGVWLNEKEKTLFFVTHTENYVDWADSRRVLDKTWDLFVVFYDEINKLIFIHSSDTSQLHKDLATAVGATTIIMGDEIFRTLGRISRLAFQQVGLKKPGRRNLRYSQYAGSDVAQALSPSQTETSTKSMLTGRGYEGGRPINIGCSYKGRVWTRMQGTINEFVAWAQHISSKLIDENISTKDVLENVMIPKPITEFPDEGVIGIEWPIEILNTAFNKIIFKNNTREFEIDLFTISFNEISENKKILNFTVSSEELSAHYSFKLDRGSFFITRTSTEYINIKIGRIEKSLEDYFFDCPPLILFVNGAELDGHLLLEPANREERPFILEKIQAWDWTGIDISKESQWRDGAKDNGTVQGKVLREYIQKGFDIVFDDDDKGEAADVICFKENAQHIDLVMLHCKYSNSVNPGSRLKDVVEVASQAIRSNKWIWKYQNLFAHIKTRESKSKRGRLTRFESGDLRYLESLRKTAKYKEIKAEIIIVQPGIAKNEVTDEQMRILSAASSYILDTVGLHLKVIGSE